MAIRAPRGLSVALLAAGAGLGCAVVGVPVSPPAGILFALQSAPLETNFDATPVGTRKGVAEVRFLREPFFTNLPIATWGDASVAAAAQEGGIRTVHYVDYELLSVLGVYVQLTVRVSGD